jgi:hypothetical protein
MVPTSTIVLTTLLLDHPLKKKVREKVKKEEKGLNGRKSSK